MAVKYPNEGELELLQNGISVDVDWTMRLYSNDHTPADDDTAADLTEAAFAGYTGQSLTRDGGVYTDGDGKASQDYEDNTYTRSAGSGSNDVYGWYIQDADDVIIAEERFATAPISLSDSQPTIIIRYKHKVYSAS